MLDKLEQLNSECFTYYNYESNWWSLFDISFCESMNLDILKKCVAKYAVGYCDGSKLTVRPSLKSNAVMFEKNGERFWFHIEKWELE